MQPLRRSARAVRRARWTWALIVGTACVLGAMPMVVLPWIDSDRTCWGPPAPPATAEACDVCAPAEPEPAPIDRRGACSKDLLPAGLVQQVSDADAAELAAMVEQWTSAGDAWQPPVVYRRGVIHVESEEDRGDDGPYPRSAAAESQRACGSAATWLRSHVRERLDGAGFQCDGNVCCYGASEYAPLGLVVFHRDADVTWSLDAWVEVYVAALGQEVVAENTGYVRAALRQLDGGQCAGEPAGHD